MTVRPLELDHALETPWWLWPNFLSLDAPLVTLVWQWFFASVFGVSLSTTLVFTLFATVWLIYAADRWLDAWRLDERKPHTPRHAFYKKYRWQVALVWLTVFMSTAVVALTRLERTTLSSGLLLLGGCVLYFLGVHTFPRVSRLLTKEIQVALVIGAGVTLMVWPTISLPSLLSFILLAFSFALLIFLNCSFIALWEKKFDAAQQFVSVTHYGKLESTLFTLSIVLFIASCVLSLCQHAFGVVALAVLGLVVLHKTRANLTPNLLRVLADAVLLTPLFYLLAVHG
jgi:hypothetical protein